uniref:Probable ABC transporter permease protein n=1 Tax=Chlorobium chlorochromatii (strain CaD3) TaxID=340177 RepID=Q3AS43_CHLCH
MCMKPALWIALRFSFARKRFRIINFISAITLAGITIGVATLLVVLSVLNGFQELARTFFLSLESPVQLVSSHNNAITVTPALLASIRTLEGVATAEPYAEGEALLATQNKSELVMLKGLSPTAHQHLQNYINAPQPLFTDSTIAVGELLALRSSLYPNQPIQLFSPELLSLGLESLTQPYLIAALTIPRTSLHTIFSIHKLFDDRYALSSLPLARQVLLLGDNNYTGIEIRGKHGVKGETLQRTLQQWLTKEGVEKSYRIRTLEEKYQSVFSVMQLEKWITFSILMLVIVLASLSLTGSLAMTVVEKQQELFYLRCLGFNTPSFTALFVMQGAITGITGTTLGTALGWGICAAQQHFGFVQLPSRTAFIIDAYPVAMQLSDFFVVGGAAIALCLIVSLYPARKAALIASSRTV